MLHEPDRLDALIAKYGGRVPRYTSYPTAVQFSAAIDAADYRQWLATLGRRDGSVSIYLHIPFCAQLCWYCGCHTKVASEASVIADYVEDLLAEIDLLKETLPEKLVVASIHFGGGTPNIMTAKELRRIVAHLAEAFDFAEGVDIAAEIDPRHLSREWAIAASEAGINRASLGVQDFHPEVQAAVNRVQPYEQVAAAADALRAAGINEINLDLIYGLPRQSLASLAATIERATTLAPDRLAMFGYAHVPWLKPHQRLIAEADLPDARMRLSMQRMSAELLEASGFTRIGLDHFARSADHLAQAAARHEVRRNFQGYTTDSVAVLLGFGASAIGRLPQGYVQNAVDVRRWRAAIAAGELPVSRGIALGPSDRLRAEIIERLMCDFSVDLAEVAARHDDVHACFDREYARLAEMQADRLVTVEGARITVTREGRDFVRSVCAVFDRYLDPDSMRHAQGV